MTGRGINNEGDIAGWTAPADPDITYPFYQRLGLSPSSIRLPVEPPTGSNAPSTGSAYGVSNDRYLVGSYSNADGSLPQSAFGVRFDAQGMQIGNVDQLNTEIGTAVIDATTHAPVVGDYIVQAINSTHDLLADVTVGADAIIDNVVVSAGTTIHLVGLMPTHSPNAGKRHWHLLRNPAGGPPLSGSIKLLGINRARRVVGFEGGRAFYADISDLGVLSPLKFTPKPDATTTILTGISDDGLMVGTSDGLRPFVAYF